MRKEGASTSKTTFLHLLIARKCEYRVSEFPSSQMVVTRKKLVKTRSRTQTRKNQNDDGKQGLSTEINYC